MGQWKDAGIAIMHGRLGVLHQDLTVLFWPLKCISGPPDGTVAVVFFYGQGKRGYSMSVKKPGSRWIYEGDGRREDLLSPLPPDQ
jgi:hypothetical protein